MSILKRFSEKERAYHQYQARQNYLREQSSIQKDMTALRQAAEAALAARETALAEKETALARIRALEAQLAQKS